MTGDRRQGWDELEATTLRFTDPCNLFPATCFLATTKRCFFKELGGVTRIGSFAPHRKT